MSKVGRNEPCPCGSGQKYKKCCESKAIDAAVERARATAAAAAARLAEDQLPRSPANAPRRISTADVQAVARRIEDYFLEEDDLDRLSYSVVELIQEKRFDEALAVCERLRADFPDVHDWLRCSAMVHEARGDLPLALDFHRRHVAFITAPERRDGYDEELIDTFRNKVTELETRLATSTA